MAKKLLEILSDKIRFKHYSIRTEQVYIHWAKRYILFHHKKDAKEMGKVEIAQFLTYLAVIRKTHDEVLIYKIKHLMQFFVYTPKCLKDKLMYGCGLRISEVLNIHIKDIDFGYDKVVSTK